MLCAQVRLPIVQYRQLAQRRMLGGTMAPEDQAARVMDAKASRIKRERDYFPLPLNAQGLLPIMLASLALYSLPTFLMEALPALQPALQPLASDILSNNWPLPLVLVYGLMVFGMEFIPLNGMRVPDIVRYFNSMQAGVQGVAPGPPTSDHLKVVSAGGKLWGGMLLAVLAMSAQLFDRWCAGLLGCSLGSTSLLLIVEFVSRVSQQVGGLLEGARLQHKLDKDRRLLQGLGSLGYY